MSRLGFGSLIAALLTVPLATADSPPPAMGNEQEPELADAEGNVLYSPAYVGPKDRHHVDFLAAWFEYLPDNDTILVSVKLAGLEKVKEQPDWFIEYGFRSNLTIQGEVNAELSVTAYKVSQQEIIQLDASILRDDQYIDVPAASAAELTTPGYLRFWIPLAFLQKYGDAVTDFSMLVVETFRPASAYVLTPVINLNQARSSSQFSFDGLEPTSIGETPEELPSNSRATTSEAEESGETPGFLLAFAALAALVPVLFRRMK